MTNNTFKTRELSLAAFLIASEVKYLGVEIIAPSMYRFKFEDPETCYDLEKKYLVIKKELLREAKEKDYGDSQ